MRKAGLREITAVVSTLSDKDKMNCGGTHSTTRGVLSASKKYLFLLFLAAGAVGPRVAGSSGGSLGGALNVGGRLPWDRGE